MDINELRNNLDVAIAELRESERNVRAICAEYRQKVRIPWLCLYSQENRRTGELQGLFWARLRRVRQGGRSVVFKDYIGTRLARREMYKLGVIREAEILEDFDRRAALIREKRKKVVAELDRVRKILRRHGKSRTGYRQTAPPDPNRLD